jgi:hypothetical protein
MSNPTPKRTYKTNSKRQKIIQYFRENPDASPAVVAKKFDYSYGATHTCKRLAAETPLSPLATMKPPEWVRKLTGTPAVQQETPKEEAPADPWRAYGLWMTREQYAGYLRGLAVSKLTRSMLGHKDLLEVNRIVTKLAELTGE